MRFTRAKTIAFIGDSITYNTTWGVLPHEFWPGQVKAFLRSLGGTPRTRNFGVSGNTTTQMLARCQQLFRIQVGGPEADPIYELPEMVVIMGGVNDPGNGISTATTQANLEQFAMAVMNRCDGVVAGQASLPATGLGDELIPIGARYLVQSDTSADGGLAAGACASVLGQPATLAGALTGPRIWIKRQNKAGVAGWSRIAPDTTRGPKSVVISSVHYDNSTTGDSQPATAAANALLNGAGLAAATAQGCLYFDLYTRLAARIAAGYTTANAAEWNVLSNNQHTNAEGGRVFAMEFVDWLGTVNVPGITPTQTWVEYLTA